MAAVEWVRCDSCRGRKQVMGVGGMLKDCKACSGVGQLKLKDVAKPSVEATVESLDALQESIAQPSIEASTAIKAEAKPVLEPDVVEQPTEVESSVTAGASPVVATPVDPVLEAILAEPGMKPDEWRAKYRNVPGLFAQAANGMLDELVSKVERENRRRLYAASQPRVKRKVNLGAQQDGVVEKDAEYKAFKAREDAKREAAEARKK